VAQKSKVSIIIDAKDRAGRVLRNIDKQIGGLKKAAIGASVGAAALGGVIGGLFVRSTTRAASTSENLRLRLDALLGSTEEGGKAFQLMAEYAATVPFSFEEIMNSSAQLAGIVSGGADEIAGLMPMIGDLAAVSGLTIQQTTEQIVRMFAAGAGAADRFRERGVLAMLGFEAGVKTTAEETKRRVIEAFEDPESKFRGASAKMAETWTGLLSMLGDRWFQFRNMVAESGFFDRVKEELETLLGAIDEAVESGQFAAWAEAMSNAAIKAIDAVKTVVDFFATLIASLKPELIEAGPGLVTAASLQDIASATRLAQIYRQAIADLEADLKSLEEQSGGLWDFIYGAIPDEDLLKDVLPKGKAGEVQKLREELDGLRLVYDALIERIGELQTAGTEAGGGGGGGGGGEPPAWLEPATDAWKKYEEALTGIGRQAEILGPQFDEQAERLKAQATLVKELVASGIPLDEALSATRVSLEELGGQYEANRQALERSAEAQAVWQAVIRDSAEAANEFIGSETLAAQATEALTLAMVAGSGDLVAFTKALAAFSRDSGKKLKETTGAAEQIVASSKRSMEQLGADLVLGLAEGAESAKDVFLSTFKQILGAAIQIGIRAILPFSPSHRSRPWGASLVQGLTAGIKDEAPNLMRTWEDTVGGFAEPGLVAPEFAPPSFSAPLSDTQFEQAEPISLRLEGPALPAPSNPLAAARDREWQEFFRETSLVAEGEGFRARAVN
jgi:hypothetical protein